MRRQSRCYQRDRDTTHDLAVTLEDFVHSLALRSGPADVADPSLRPPPVGFGAPSALPTRGIHFPVRRVPPESPAALTVGRSRSFQLGSHSAGPPYLVAGFHPRFGPPAPFLTTLAVCSSSGPVECFIHSRPWGSCPGSPMRTPGRRARRPFFPGLVRVMRTKSACHTKLGGQDFTQEAPGRPRAGQLPKHPSVRRGHRSHLRGDESGSSSPLRRRTVSVT